VHELYGLGGSQRNFVDSLRIYPLAVLRDAEKAMRAQAHRDDIRDRRSYFAAVVRKLHDEHKCLRERDDAAIARSSVPSLFVRTVSEAKTVSEASTASEPASPVDVAFESTDAVRQARPHGKRFGIRPDSRRRARSWPSEGLPPVAFGGPADTDETSSDP
jgi:hypothetical protein